MSTQTETKQRGRPASFTQPTKMAGFNLPLETLAMLAAAVTKRNESRKEGVSRVNQNTLVDRALRAYLRDRKSN